MAKWTEKTRCNYILSIRYITLDVKTHTDEIERIKKILYAYESRGGLLDKTDEPKLSLETNKDIV